MAQLQEHHAGWVPESGDCWAGSNGDVYAPASVQSPSLVGLPGKAVSSSARLSKSPRAVARSAPWLREGTLSEPGAHVDHSFDLTGALPLARWRQECSVIVSALIVHQK